MRLKYTLGSQQTTVKVRIHCAIFLQWRCDTIFGKYFMYADYYVLRYYLYLTLTLTHRHTWSSSPIFMKHSPSNRPCNRKHFTRQVSGIVAESRIRFYFCQRLQQLASLLHRVDNSATCVATPLRDKLQRKLLRTLKTKKYSYWKLFSPIFTNVVCSLQACYLLCFLELR
jgi:hypothetical protein